MLQEEGLEKAWARHKTLHHALRAGLEAMGLNFIVPEGSRLAQLNAVSIPEGIDEAVLRKRLLHEYDLEIGAGLGTLAGKVWRIGLMGYSANASNVMFCLASLESVLSDMDATINTGVALPAAQQALPK